MRDVRYKFGLGHIITRDVLDEVAHERSLQDGKWGEQNHPDGTSSAHTRELESARYDNAEAVAEDRLDWALVMREEFWEAMSETDPAKLRAELIQLAAVAVAWVEAIDRRTAK